MFNCALIVIKFICHTFGNQASCSWMGSASDSGAAEPTEMFAATAFMSHGVTPLPQFCISSSPVHDPDRGDQQAAKGAVDGIWCEVEQENSRTALGVRGWGQTFKKVGPLRTPPPQFTVVLRPPMKMLGLPIRFVLALTLELGWGGG